MQRHLPTARFPFPLSAFRPLLCILPEFGLLIKQQLYFDRYTKILAPTLDPLRDSRIQMQMKVEEGHMEQGLDTPPNEEEGLAVPASEEQSGRSGLDVENPAETTA